MVSQLGRPKKITSSGTVPPRKQQIEEIMRCGRDPSYFISKYVKISHPLKGTLPFETYEYQDRCLKAFQENRFVITNKSRQLGLSTLSAAYSLWMALFQKEKNILCIATRLDVAKNFVKKVDGMLNSLPPWLVLPQIAMRSVKHIQFSNGSKIQAVPTGQDAGRSEALSLLILDEAAHIENVDELWLGLRPTLSTGGSAILISSPSGVGTLFHKIWVGARTGEDGKQQPNPGQGTNEFYRIELPWWVHPEHNQEWFEKEKAEILPAKGERGIGMELLCSFISSGDTFLSGDIVQELEKGCQSPIDHGGPAGKVWIWKQVVSNHKYIIAADVARGDADDFSTFQVIDTTDDEQVAEFQGKIPPDQLSDLMIEFGLRYNKAMLCPELNSYGLMTATALKKSGYMNLYYEKYSRNVYGIVPTSAEVQDEYPGITTGVKNREEMLAKLEQTLRNKKIRIYSTRLVGPSGEIKTFIWKNNRAQAMKGYNDDLIMSLAFANALYEASGITTHDSSEITKNMIAGMSRRSITFTGQESNQTVNSPIQRGNLLDQPIIPTSMEIRQRSGGNQAQDMNDNFWSQFSWVIRDR
jgi:hypothetical protein